MLESPKAPFRGPDEEVLKLLQARNPDGLRRLLDEHGPRVNGGLRREFRHVLDDGHIEEAVSLAAHRAWRSADTFDRDRGSLRSWFYVIARNCALRVLHRERRERRFTLVTDWERTTYHSRSQHGPKSDEPDKDPAREQTHAAFLADLRQCIDALPRMQRAIIEADLEAGGLAGAAALGRKLGTSVNAIYAQRAMARRALRMALVRRGHFQEFSDIPPEEGERP